MLEPGHVVDLSDHTIEILATPTQTGDRYRVRVVAEPGGGPGVKGAGPHTHPGLVEIFRLVSGTMTVRIGRDLQRVRSADPIEVGAGTVHGFVNDGDGPLTVDTDLVFTPPGPRPQADPMTFAAIYAGLVHDGRVSRLTKEPKLLQMAVLVRDYGEAMSPPGALGRALRALAPVGHLRGYTSSFPEYGA